jgi:hypothetical protein
MANPGKVESMSRMVDAVRGMNERAKSKYAQWNRTHASISRSLEQIQEYLGVEDRGDEWPTPKHTATEAMFDFDEWIKTQEQAIDEMRRSYWLLRNNTPDSVENRVGEIVVWYGIYRTFPWLDVSRLADAVGSNIIQSAMKLCEIQERRLKSVAYERWFAERMEQETSWRYMQWQ